MNNIGNFITCEINKCGGGLLGYLLRYGLRKCFNFEFNGDNGVTLPLPRIGRGVKTDGVILFSL